MRHTGAQQFLLRYSTHVDLHTHADRSLAMAVNLLNREVTDKHLSMMQHTSAVRRQPAISAALK